jgi:protein-disulfide isomerase
MARRIFFVIAALIAAFLCFNIYKAATVNTAPYRVADTYAFGPADADLTVVEFLDYSCPYCRQVHPTIIAAIREDGKIRYIPRPLPSQDENSNFAAFLAYTAGLQGKFFEMHGALIEGYRTIDEAVLQDMAGTADVDLDRLNVDMKKSKAKDMLAENARLFAKIGTNATPTFIIGRDKVFVPEGKMPEVQDFLNMFNEARAQAEK